jgi:hypothetical protein
MLLHVGQTVHVRPILRGYTFVGILTEQHGAGMLVVELGMYGVLTIELVWYGALLSSFTG